MNSERIDEVTEQQVAINRILGGWDTSMNENHYYLLRGTLTDMLDYVMDNTIRKL